MWTYLWYNKTFYAFHSNSDDNLLKNIELFDKLSLRFNGRILFIKDVIGSQEICCWSYFGHGLKIAEVCCTSIVYGTDKKHTKVSSDLSIFCQSSNTAAFGHHTVPVGFQQTARIFCVAIMSLWCTCVYRCGFRKVSHMLRMSNICIVQFSRSKMLFPHFK